MFGDLYMDTNRIIENWNPKEKFSNENGYRDDLATFLIHKFNDTKNPFGLPNRTSVTKESGRGLCDIAIDKKIGIELKKDLKSKSQIDRLMGQILEYKKDYRDIIIVLVGNSKENSIEELKAKVSDLNRQNMGIMSQTMIKIINKGTGSKMAKKTSSPFSNY